MKLSVRQFRNVLWEEIDKDDKNKKARAKEHVRIMPVGKDEDEHGAKFVSGSASQRG